MQCNSIIIGITFVMHYFIYLFVVSLKTLSLAQIIQRRMIGRLMNNEFAKIWKEAALA
jgi:hypothetical protein